MNMSRRGAYLTVLFALLFLLRFDHPPPPPFPPTASQFILITVYLKFSYVMHQKHLIESEPRTEMKQFLRIFTKYIQLQILYIMYVSHCMHCIKVSATLSPPSTPKSHAFPFFRAIRNLMALGITVIENGA